MNIKLLRTKNNTFSSKEYLMFHNKNKKAYKLYVKNKNFEEENDFYDIKLS